MRSRTCFAGFTICFLLFTTAALGQQPGSAAQVDRLFAAWDRKDDTVGLAFEVAGISNAARAYLAAGGLGVLVGDGRLPNYGAETVVETYYDVQLIKGINAALDYQFVANPAYNTDRGPVNVFAGRFHWQF